MEMALFISGSFYASGQLRTKSRQARLYKLVRNFASTSSAAIELPDEA